MARKVVSGLRTRPLIFLASLLVIIGSYVLYSDITGAGIKDSIFYKILGYGSYPVFYGAVVVGLWQLALMFSGRTNYLAVDGDRVAIGNRIIAADDISRIVSRHTSLVGELVIEHRGGKDVVVKAYMLSRPADDVVADLSALVFRRERRRHSNPRAA